MIARNRLLQLKHHMGSAGDLTDKSPDLWRSVAVWLDLLALLPPHEQPVFGLITTSEAPSDSAARWLGADEARDEAKALERLEKAATDSTNTATAAARSSFLALDDGRTWKPTITASLAEASSTSDSDIWPTPL